MITGFADLPQEVKDKIYDFLFADIRVSPFIASSDEAYDRERFSTSRLGMLLLSRSQQPFVYASLWGKATLWLGDELHLTAFAIRDRPLTSIRHVVLDVGICLRPPMVLMSKALRLLQNCESIALKIPVEGLRTPAEHRRAIQFESWEVFSECIENKQDPRTTELITPLLNRVVGSDRATTRTFSFWIMDLLHQSMNKWIDSPPTVSIQFFVYCGTGETYDNGVPAAERIDVMFSSSTWTVSGTYKGTSFDVPQISLEQFRKRRLIPPTKLVNQTNILKDHAEYEKPVWSSIDKYYSDVKVSTEMVADLYHLLDVSDMFTNGFDELRANDGLWGCQGIHCAWKVGVILLDRKRFSYEKAVSSQNASKDIQWDIWRRILGAEDKNVLSRPWRDAYDVCSQVSSAMLCNLDHDEKSLAEVRELLHETGSLNYQRQRAFFSRLFDPKKPWMYSRKPDNDRI
ncbi:uncharacterized protein AB675_5192 [Cyphellophora attinorum]|uniref:Uncharacterized protein n=1 Tax=Cyphellophora attinorum TaxID=1664694 RepID=A0A0N1HNW1_9EURO|nr:uncharacterized protein AB675_5192 [Phialophora attinorum]KPI39300.1 hypothetical protein AB675_5192 [Phialophora attinorum]